MSKGIKNARHLCRAPVDLSGSVRGCSVGFSTVNFAAAELAALGAQDGVLDCQDPGAPLANES